METRSIIALIVLGIVSVVDCKKTCPAKYARFSAQHSFCLEKNPKCNILKEGVDSNDINVILKIHNELRSKVANGKQGNLPTASNMLQMEWDSELAEVAQKWATQCNFNHDCKECRAVENFKAGQNLAIQKSSCSTNDCLKPEWESRIIRFYDEVKDFNKNYISPYQHQSAYGHFSQVVWADSWRVGCGYVAYKEDNLVKRLYACNYGPAGNDPGSSLYKQGAPGSACPPNTCATCRVQGPTYLGLCKIQNLASGPGAERMKDTIADYNFREQNSLGKVRTSGNGNWRLQPSVGGSYATVQLKPGEKSTLQLPGSIQPKTSGFCVKVVYRKGPVNAAEKDLGSLTLAGTVQNQRMPTTINMKSPQGFTTFQMTYSWNMKTEVALDLSVPAGSSEYIFDIKEIVAYEGKCKR